MEKRKKKEHDFSITAFRVVQQATGQVGSPSEKPRTPKVSDAKALGHKGGLKGDRARVAKLTAEERREIARKAAQARWKKT